MAARTLGKRSKEQSEGDARKQLRTGEKQGPTSVERPTELKGGGARHTASNAGPATTAVSPVMEVARYNSVQLIKQRLDTACSSDDAVPPMDNKSRWKVIESWLLMPRARTPSLTAPSETKESMQAEVLDGATDDKAERRSKWRNRKAFLRSPDPGTDEPLLPFGTS